MSENKVDAIIKSINDLNNEEKRELTIKVRTTPEGNKAYVSFLYGVTSSASEVVVEEPEEPTSCEEESSKETRTESNEGTESGTNGSEEWL